MGDIPRRMRRFSRDDGENSGYERPDKGIADSLEYGRDEEPQRRETKNINQNEEAAEAIYNQLKLQREMKDKTSEMAIREVKTFKEEHKRYPTDNEYDEIADSIYGQLKEEYEKEKRKEDEARRLAKEREKEIKKRGREEGPAERKGGKKDALQGRGRVRGRDVPSAFGEEEGPREGRGLEEEAGVSPIGEPDNGKSPDADDIAKLLGESPAGEEKDTLDIGGLSESKGFDLSALGLEMEDGGDDDDLLTLEAETDKNKCPHCGTKTEDLIFCPNCGEGFCTHCASKAELSPGSIKYACPKCKHEFKVRK